MKERLKTFTATMATLTDEEFEAYALLFRPMQVKRMNHIFTEGHLVKHIYYLDHGVMRSYYMNEGREITSGFHFAPFIMTDIFSLREKVPTAMNLQALRDTECYEISIDELEALIVRYPNLLNVFFKLYEILLLRSKKRQLSLIYDQPRERYLKLFKERPEIIAEIPQHYIASYLGIQPETLSRIKRKIF
ncbi:Crp/Fnr family transcriptional regulator [Flavobacterium sp. MFBS3-15]|uniref:Crp/Fnr family transcriptional regulator n=1 Tax=Flavobacterium sp. MFBS3-15 TaxID=2989816 RepID=UPI002236A6E7|nr:Crp/Fnr family transcriptional regulator [Flavobacterium sp. MFBS3-15]MCW4467705.1 Crp/Fnr family transcriptional regulator [Flavobacterium sp. MFBS3-15]